MPKKLFVVLCPLLFLFVASCSLSPDQLKTAEKLMTDHPDSALHILKKVRKFQLLNPRDKALHALLLSQAYDRNSIPIASDSLIRIATRYYTESSPELSARAWFYSSRCFRNRGDAATQAAHLFKAQKMAENTSNFKLQALIYSDKADIYQQQNQLDSCILLNKKGMLAFRMANDPYNACLSAISVGVAYSMENRTDSCMYYLQMVEKMAYARSYKELLSPVYKTMGKCMMNKSDFARALYYYRKAPVTGTAEYDDNTWYLLANAFVQNHQIDSAQYYLKKISRAGQDEVAYLRLRKKISMINHDLPKAIHYADKLVTIKDSLYYSSLKVSLAGMEKQYSYDKITLKVNQLEIESNRKTILSLIFGLIISVGFALFFFRHSNIKNKQLKTEIELNEKKKELLEKAEENNDLLQHQIEIEKELIEKEKDLLIQAKDNNRLLEMQTQMQQQLLLFIEQYRIEAGKGKNDMQAKIDDENMRKQIILYVDSKYNNISRRLYAELLELELTERDVYICCMLLAGFTTGMIAVILGLQLNSVNVLRGRLRKKLGIETNEKLVEALEKL